MSEVINEFIEKLSYQVAELNEKAVRQLLAKAKVEVPEVLDAQFKEMLVERGIMIEVESYQIPKGMFYKGRVVLRTLHGSEISSVPVEIFSTDYLKTRNNLLYVTVQEGN